MSTAMNTTEHHHQHSTFGFLLIISELINNEQRDEILRFLRYALKKIDKNHPLVDINERFTDLINEKDFQLDSQYRQVDNTEDGSLVGFLYMPNFHTVNNVLHDYFDHCSTVCLIVCAQQIDSNGAFILTDSLFTTEHFSRLFENDGSTRIENLQLMLPFVSSDWKKLFQERLAKRMRHVHIDDASGDIDEENRFGEIFYQKLSTILQDDTVNFDIHTKLIPRDSSGTIAFDEPNLYVLYGQQGEASLFGVRGFVVLVNGGFNRLPSYWNLVRGLQSIDACILTHFDYDVLPGLQSVIHRKTIPSPFDGRLCKPDIGVLFLNQIQRTKLPSTSKSSHNPLLINLHENIDELVQDVQQLKIHAIDLVKPAAANKTIIEPINLYKKIAYGSLDLFVLHPLVSSVENERIISTLQKIPIHDRLPNSQTIPIHHWYSSCSLLVWTPALKSDNNSLVRILYTGVCPQTLIFEALNRVQHLHFLRASSSSSSKRNTPAFHLNHFPAASEIQPKAQVKRSSSQPKTNNKARSPTPKKTSKGLPTSTPAPAAKPVKKEKITPKVVPKKTPVPTPSKAPRSTSKEKKTVKPIPIPKKTSPPISKPKAKPIGQPKHVSVNQDKQEKQLNLTQTLERNVDFPGVPTIPEEEDQPEVNESTVEDHLESFENHDEQQEENHEESVEITNHESEPEQIDNNDEEQVNQEVDNETSAEGQSEDELQESEVIISSTEDNNECNDDFHQPTTQTESINGSLHDQSFDEAELIDNPSNIDTNDDADMEIIHHDMTELQKNEEESNEKIDPQGLPIESKQAFKNAPSKKHTNAVNRTSRPSTLLTNGNVRSSSQTKQNSSTDLIYHVDVAYIPNHGHENYVDKEFFRRIRAEFYILNAVEIHRRTLESLIEGKEQWESNEQITLVPTSDNDTLRQFFLMNKNRLSDLNINILPASSRCHVQYDDEGSPAQRLRFNSASNMNEF